MVDLRYFSRTFNAVSFPRLTLDFSKDIAAMPGEDGIPGQSDIAPSCLVVDKNGHFDVVSYLYKDALAVRYFTNGDMPRPETDFAGWALLPDFNS